MYDPPVHPSMWEEYYRRKAMFNVGLDWRYNAPMTPTEPTAAAFSQPYAPVQVGMGNSDEGFGSAAPTGSNQHAGQTSGFGSHNYGNANTNENVDHHHHQDHRHHEVATDDNNGETADGYEYVLNSTHPVQFEELPSTNAYQVTYGLRIIVHDAAVITFVPVEEQSAADPARYQYLIESTHRVRHLVGNNALESKGPITYQARQGSKSNNDADSIMSLNAETTPSIVGAVSTGLPATTQAQGGEKIKPTSWVETAVIKPVWAIDKKGKKRTKERGLAPTHYQCKLCTKRAKGNGDNKKKNRKRKRGQEKADDEDGPHHHHQKNKEGDKHTDEDKDLEPFQGVWGEHLRHFQSARPRHQELWNQIYDSSQQKYVCTFPKLDKATGRAQRDDRGHVKTCGFAHGRPDNVNVDHMASSHNAEAPGDPRAHTQDEAYLKRKKVDCRKAILQDEYDALNKVRARILDLETELAQQSAAADTGTGRGTPYVSVHGLDLTTSWSVLPGEESAPPAAIARVRRLAELTGRRQFRSQRPGSWHQVALDLEAGLRPESCLARALDAHDQSQGKGRVATPHCYWDYFASRPELGDAGMVPLAPGLQSAPIGRRRGGSGSGRRGAKPKSLGKGEEVATTAAAAVDKKEEAGEEASTAEGEEE